MIPSRQLRDPDDDGYINEFIEDVSQRHRLPDPPEEVFIDIPDDDIVPQPIRPYPQYPQPVQPTTYQAPIEHARPASDNDIDFAGRRLIGDFAESIRSSSSDELDEVLGVNDRFDPNNPIPINQARVDARSVYTEPAYGDLANRIKLSLGVFDDATFNEVRPRIKQALEQGFASKKGPEDIELDLDKI